MRSMFASPLARLRALAAEQGGPRSLERGRLGEDEGLARAEAALDLDLGAAHRAELELGDLDVVLRFLVLAPVDESLGPGALRPRHGPLRRCEPQREQLDRLMAPQRALPDRDPLAEELRARGEQRRALLIEPAPEL